MLWSCAKYLRLALQSNEQNRCAPLLSVDIDLKNSRSQFAHCVCLCRHAALVLSSSAAWSLLSKPPGLYNEMGDDTWLGIAILTLEYLRLADRVGTEVEFARLGQDLACRTCSCLKTSRSRRDAKLWRNLLSFGQFEGASCLSAASYEGNGALIISCLISKRQIENWVHGMVVCSGRLVSKATRLGEEELGRNFLLRSLLASRKNCCRGKLAPLMTSKSRTTTCNAITFEI